jgi:hypothetical protein
MQTAAGIQKQGLGRELPNPREKAWLSSSRPDRTPARLLSQRALGAQFPTVLSLQLLHLRHFFAWAMLRRASDDGGAADA